MQVTGISSPEIALNERARVLRAMCAYYDIDRATLAENTDSGDGSPYTMQSVSMTLKLQEGRVSDAIVSSCEDALLNIIKQRELAQANRGDYSENEWEQFAAAIKAKSWRFRVERNNLNI